MLTVTESSQQLPSIPYQLTLVLLGFGLRTSVTRGENAVKILDEDFVVLDVQQQQITDRLHFPMRLTSHKVQQLAIVLRLSDLQRGEPYKSAEGFVR